MAIQGLPEPVGIKFQEIRDEFKWLVSEMKELAGSDDFAEFSGVLDSVLEYTEDFHSALEELETVVAKFE